MVPDALDRTFEAVVFDWDGTAVPDRRADADAVRCRIEELCAAGVHVVVVSGTHVGNVDGQLRARPRGPGRLHLCLNRGSEVFEADAGGTRLVWDRDATGPEDEALDRAAAAAVEGLRGRGLDAAVVSRRKNRRKIDLLPDAAWTDPPKARIAELLDAVTARLHRAGVGGLDEVVETVRGAARGAGLADPRITSDAKHVELGLTDKSDSARWAARWLAERGITGSLVLIGGDEFGAIAGAPGSDSSMLVPELRRAVAVSVGVEPQGTPAGVLHLPGGPERFLGLLDDQLARRRDLRVPWIDDDPAWVVLLPEDPGSERDAESIGTLSNGWAAVRGSREEDGPETAPQFLVNGVYTSDPVPELLTGPPWTDLDAPGGRGQRRLDLRTATLARDDPPSRLRTLRFVSAARPHALGLRAEASPARLRSGPALPADGAAQVARTGSRSGGGIAVAARDEERHRSTRQVVERLAAWAADPSAPPDGDEVARRLAEVRHEGFDRLLAEHRAAWAGRWADAEVTIEGAPEDQLAARFAVFHLLGAAPDAGEAAVGARGLTGPAYGGHVFWDADVYMLPSLAAIRPAAARAMLEYRVRRLPAARAAAARLGFRGARFPWESATSGDDVTPGVVPGPGGAPVPVRTGDLEEHIVADVAWAACEYVAWTGDHGFLAADGGALLADAARYWASRIRNDADGNGHLDALMGPDEYHEVVDDNAYTNVMARWNLRRAAAHAEATGGDLAEAATWRVLADRLVDGWDPATGLYEQFAGYWELEPLLVAQVAEPPVAADVLLGAERVAGSQVIKQPDVVMLHHLVPGEVVAGSLAANLAFYEPRTAHGSSLSPAIHAALQARAGHPDHALDLFRLAARLDLDDLTGTTAGGLHLGTMGGLWQALAYGFLGLRPRRSALDVDPRLPSAWDALGLRLRFRGQPIAVRADHDAVTVTCTAPLSVRVAGGPARRCAPPGRRFTLTGPVGDQDEGSPR